MDVQDAGRKVSVITLHCTVSITNPKPAAASCVCHNSTPAEASASFSSEDADWSVILSLDENASDWSCSRWILMNSDLTS